ncbi:MAG: OmpA family protein [Bacteroidota bacterium]
MIEVLKKYNRALVLILFWFVSLPGYTQIEIDTSRNAEYLVEEILLGQGVLVGNVKFTGTKYAMSLFTDQESNLGIEQGIILTSGNAYYSRGPNETPRMGWASAAPGDHDLEAITRGRTYDAAILEFDFITASENLVFEYVFASEEYLEYVGSKFNDVFAFFVDGPGMPKTNIARLPDGKTAITINNVNNELNSEYFIDNTFHNTTDPYVWDARNRKVIANKKYLKEQVPPKYNTQFDGFTTVLEARCKVIPNKVYHIKIAISDVSDGILDSGVFLKAGSFRSYGDIVAKVDRNHFNEVKEVPLISSKKKDLLYKPPAKPMKIRERGIRREPSVMNVEFDFDKFDLSEEALETIKKVYDILVTNPFAKVQLVGHTDNFGSNDYNIELSQHRSQAVAAYLRWLGTAPERIKIEYFGEEKPIENNSSEKGRARNRRVEFIINYQ